MSDALADTRTTKRLFLEADDGHRILVDAWTSDIAPKGIIQIVHGLGEYCARYARFAAVCNAEGFHVFSHNHRGHGETCREEDLGHFADRNGWDKVLADTDHVQQFARKKFPGLPVVLIGHSMGSFIAQSYLVRGMGNVDALLLSASTFGNRAELAVGRWLAKTITFLFGRRGKSALLNKLGFGDFNKRFAPNRTDFDWLSRDMDEVDKYAADPLCGFLNTNKLWVDLMGGIREYTSVNALRSIDAALPVLITGGTADPVGGQHGLTRLADAWRESGHERVTLKMFEEGRHEMLNEVNRDEVTRYWLQWIDGAIGDDTTQNVS